MGKKKGNRGRGGAEAATEEQRSHSVAMLVDALGGRVSVEAASRMLDQLNGDAERYDHKSHHSKAGRSG
jgi:hypothetical protein